MVVGRALALASVGFSVDQDTALACVVLTRHHSLDSWASYILLCLRLSRPLALVFRPLAWAVNHREMLGGLQGVAFAGGETPTMGMVCVLRWLVQTYRNLHPTLQDADPIMENIMANSIVSCTQRPLSAVRASWGSVRWGAARRRVFMVVLWNV